MAVIYIGVPNGNAGIICGSGWGLNTQPLRAIAHNRVESDGFYCGEPVYQVEAAVQIIGLVIVPAMDSCIGIDKKSDLAKMMQEW